MAGSWNQELAMLFWSKRTWHQIGRIDNLEEKETARITQLQQSQIKEEEEKQAFFIEYQHLLHDSPTNTALATMEVVSHLSFWMKFCSWTYCSKCLMINEEKLLPKFSKKPPLKTAKNCICSKNRYVVPMPSLIPEQLLDLSFSDICILRPFEFHTGNYERLRFGYRQKNGKCHLKWSDLSVEEKIENITSASQKNKCLNAYNFLMSFQRSSYSSFIRKREQMLEENRQINLYDLEHATSIECALWPNLYPFTEWCDTVHRGNESRLSQKVSFFTKVKSCILDYSISFELLQFNYDMWLFKTVSGAISSARHMKCSPARALDAKVFSVGYWKMQHRLLIDAVKQFGYPDLFLTLSPYEWTFPFHEVLESARVVTGRGPTELAGLETLHISHVLEQLVRGYLCGSNTKKWSKNVFSYRNSQTQKNVKTYFYRFEFQQRGTVHLHLLVWLKNVKEMQHKVIRADIPWESPECAFIVNKIQPSDKRWLHENNEQTSFEEVNERTVLKFHYPKEAFVLNLRAYIETVIPTLKCRMDVQATDGRHMVLRYVTSYVSKWKDAYTNESLYSPQVLPYQAAYRIISQFQPCEPEMWLYLSPIKFAWSCSRTKNYTVPTSNTVGENKDHQKYTSRPKEMENLSFLEWLRNVDNKSASTKPYKDGNCLVSCKIVSPFRNEYFFQELLMNHPHRKLAELRKSNFEEMPEEIRFFSTVLHLIPAKWTNDDIIREHVRREGNKEYFVETVMAHFACLRDTLQMWERKFIKTAQLTFHRQMSELSFPLDNFQNAILTNVMQKLVARHNYYEEEMANDEGLDDSDREDNHSPHVLPEVVQGSAVDWRKWTLVTGEAGSGKSQIVCASIQKAIEHGWNVLVACPTGILARQYSNKFSSENLLCDTVHSCFLIPLNVSERPQVNWHLSEFDIIILDELSMVSLRIAKHILTTITELTVRPVVLVTGDPQQTQPIETFENKIQQVPNIFSDNQFYNIVQSYSLRRQYRVVDEKYDKFLKHIRYWTPTQAQLDSIQNGRIICDTAAPTDEDISSVFELHSDATVLTFTRNATCRVNYVYINKLFKDTLPLITVQCDDELEPCPIYRHMKVLITQNRNKSLNIVNGQLATVHCVLNATIFLKLSNQQIAPIYPVTYLDKEGKNCVCYPFTPCYALTIAKAIGLTLDKVILWLDIAHIPRGMGYVALSRVRRLENLILLTRVTTEQCLPVNFK